jgi:hypothetical protein
MRQTGDDRHGRLRALIVVLWRGGLRIQEALAADDVRKRRPAALRDPKRRQRGHGTASAVRSSRPPLRGINAIVSRTRRRLPHAPGPRPERPFAEGRLRRPLVARKHQLLGRARLRAGARPWAAGHERGASSGRPTQPARASACAPPRAPTPRRRPPPACSSAPGERAEIVVVIHDQAVVPKPRSSHRAPPATSRLALAGTALSNARANPVAHQRPRA